MTQRAPLHDLLGWMDAGTVSFLQAVQRLDDGDFERPSALPGWSNAHIVAHVGFNATALMNLVAWATTGVRTPMYASAEQRNEDISTGAAWGPGQLRAFAAETAQELDASLAAMPEEQWHADIVTAQGREVTAVEIPWMRAREVAIHAVDLGNGAEFADYPDDFCRTLISDVVTKRSSQPPVPGISLVADDGSEWQLGDGGRVETVRGSVHELAAWLTGRSSGARLHSFASLPALGPWL